MFDESVCLRTELEYKATTLQLENQRLQDEIASYIVMQEQNAVLKQALSELHDRARDAELRHKEEFDQLKESISEHKMKLQKEFKLRLQEMSGQRSEEAMLKLDDGKAGGAHVNVTQKKADDSTSHVSVLMVKYEELEKDNAKVHTFVCVCVCVCLSIRVICLCVYVCLYVYVYMCAFYVYLSFVYVCVRACVRARACAYTNTHINTYIHIHSYIFMPVLQIIVVKTHIHTYIHTHIHTHIHALTA